MPDPNNNNNKRKRQWEDEPFAHPQQQQPPHNHKNVVLMDHLISFVDGGNHPKGLPPLQATAFLESLEYLYQYLLQQQQQRKQEDDPKNPFTMQVTQLVLPWVIRQLIHEISILPQQNDTTTTTTTSNSTETTPKDPHGDMVMEPKDESTTMPKIGGVSFGLYWKLLHVSLETVLSWSSHVSGVVSSILTQSVLTKLVPFMALLAIPGGAKDDNDDHEDSTTSCHFHAAQAYQILVNTQRRDAAPTTDTSDNTRSPTGSTETTALFRPNLEVAVQSILLPLVQALPEEPDPTAVVLVQQTLQWMLDAMILSRGNPKTIFQTLVQPPVLVALSQLYHKWGDGATTSVSSLSSSHQQTTPSAIQKLIRQMMSHGLVSSNHHMEGLLSILKQRSTTTTKKQQKEQQPPNASPKNNNQNKNKKKAESQYRMYQEELLSRLTNQDPDLVRIWPVLLDEFLSQWTVYRSLQKKSSGSHAPAGFAMYKAMATPLLSEETWNHQAHVLLQSLRQLTELLIAHTAYLPSQDDHEQSQTKFLQRIVTRLLESPQASPVALITNVDHLSESIALLQKLTQLNHTLIHEKLVEAILLSCAGALQIHGTDDESSPSSSSILLLDTMEQFWRCLIETYQKLRQQRHLIQSFLCAISAWHEKGDPSPAHPTLMGSLLQRPLVVSALERAMETSPMSEIQGTFAALEGWFSKQCQLNDDEEDQAPLFVENTTVVRVGVELAVLLFRSIRVSNEASALATSQLVKSFTQRVVGKLSDRVSNDDATIDSINIQSALKLCAWLIQLQEQCAFWLGREHQLEIPSGIETEIARCTKNPSRHKEESMMLLVCHRLQQIAYLVHDEELALLQKRVDDDSQSDKLKQFHMEGEELAALLTSAAEHEIDSSTSSSSHRKRRGWLYTAKCAHLWAVYAKDSAIDNFLDLVLSSLVSPSKNTNPHDKEARQVAMELLQDMSFLDVNVFGRRLHMASLFRLSKWLVPLIDANEKDSQVLGMLESVSRQEFFPESTGEMIEILSSFDPRCLKQPIHSTELEQSINDAAFSLNFVNELPTNMLETADVESYAKMAIFMEWVVASLDCGDLSKPLIALSCTLRVSLGQPIFASKGDSLNMILGNHRNALSYMKHLQTSTSKMLESKQDVGPQILQELLSSTEKLMTLACRQLICCAVDEGQLQIAFGGISALAKNHIRKENRDASDTSLDGFLTARGFIAGAEDARRTGCLEGESCQSLLLELWAQCFQLFQLGGLVDQMSTTGEATKIHEKYENLVLGDLLSSAKKWNVHDMQRLQEMESSIKSKLVKCSLEDEDTRRTLYYCLGSMVQAQPSFSQIEIIINEISKTNKTNQLLEAAFCDLMNDHLNSDEINTVVQKLVSFEDYDGPSILTRIRLIVLALDTVKGISVTETLSKWGRQIFQLAIRKMCPIDRSDPSWEGEVVETVHLFQALIRRKDVLILCDKDPAVILCCLNAAVGGGLTHRDSPPVSTPIFVGCCKTVLLLVQRCSKQLYPCVHSVISVMYSFLHSCLRFKVPVHPSGSFRSTEKSAASISLTACSNEFTRLCESLVAHREVYKKHVVGVVLDFVHHLGRRDTPLAVKNALLPAIHCLLDMFSIHETKQLNAMMDTQCKSMFRSIYQSYRKLHAYKGS